MGRKTRYFILKNKLILAILLAILLYLPVMNYRSVQKQLAQEEPRRLDELSHRLSRSLQPALADLVALSAQPVARAYLEDGQNLQAFAELLRGMIVRNPGFDQIRYLDETGMEIVRFNQDPGNGVYRVPPKDLQDKSGRYYFQDTVHGEAGMVYLSPFDLNVENGVIETPPKPMIRVAAPLHDLAGQERGILIINVLGRPLLDMVESFNGHHQRYLLLNREGYYLAGGTPGNQWGFMWEEGRDWRLAQDSPEAWLRIQGRRSCQFMLDGSLHTARKVQVASLLVSSHTRRASFVRSLTRMTDHSGYHWVLVSRLDRGAVLAAFLPRFLLLAEGLIPLVALILVVLWRRTWTHVALEKMERRQEETSSELTVSREQVNTLEGLLPICSSCSMIRDDEGYWSGVADYLTRHQGIHFTHGICQDCLQELYGDMYEEEELEALRNGAQHLAMSPRRPPS